MLGLIEELEPFVSARFIVFTSQAIQVECPFCVELFLESEIEQHADMHFQ